MIKIIIINHTFQKPEFYKRWQLLAHSHDDIDITLLAPSEWAWGKEKTLTYGHVDHLQGKIVEEDRFRIHLIDTQLNSMGEWTSVLLEKEILEARPDFVYYIGGYTAKTLMQIIDIKRKHKLSDMKVLSFTMRGHTPTFAYTDGKFTVKQSLRFLAKQVILRPRFRRFKKHCDAVFCHYPAAMDAFKKEGYDKPVFMQTQVGVDPDVFYPSEVARQKIREKYNIGDAFLFGSASRFNPSKGLNEIIDALPQEGNWKYLMMGWGRDDEVEGIKRKIAERGFEDRIILTGFIDNWTDMAEHWNALDCAIHTPLTTYKWEETFSLALVQAMATRLPVIGSSSGSVPYQIGPDGIIVPERDVAALREKIEFMMNHPEECKRVGEKMYERAINCFSIYHLDELFYLTIKDLMNGIYDEKKSDMANCSVKMIKQ